MNKSQFLNKLCEHSDLIYQTGSGESLMSMDDTRFIYTSIDFKLKVPYIFTHLYNNRFINKHDKEYFLVSSYKMRLSTMIYTDTNYIVGDSYESMHSFLSTIGVQFSDVTLRDNKFKQLLND